jgi:hypothetical protein
MNARIGIDFGGVIVRNLHEDTGEDTSLQNSSGEQAAIDGALDAIRQLCSACNGQVWIVSKASPRMQERTLSWLQSVHFFSCTGLQPDHVRFCLQREDKATICRELEITHFIDDRVHVMQILRGVVPQLCLFGAPGAERFCPPWATFATNWSEVVGWVSGSLQADCPTRPFGAHPKH